MLYSNETINGGEWPHQRPARGVSRSFRQRRFAAHALAVFLVFSCEVQAEKMPIKFWNLTASTITELHIAPVGTQQWSPNLCLNDPDHAVDPDERLTLPAMPDGAYDMRVTDKTGRQCIFHGVPIKVLGPYAFSVSEEQMKGCGAR